jgi:hypothetical protein
VSRSAVTTRASPASWVRAALPRWPVILTLAATLTLAACGGLGGRPSTYDADEAAYWTATRGGLIKMDSYHGWAFGRIWRRETRDENTRKHGGIDAYRWAIRACQGVIDGQTPEAMVRAVHAGDPQDEVKFTQHDAKVVVTAALRTMCRDHRPVPAAATPLNGRNLHR